MPKLCCDDDSMKADDPLCIFAELSIGGMRKLGCHRYGTLDIPQRLEKAGFSNIRVVKKKVPISPWARDKELNALGMVAEAYSAGVMESYATKPFDALAIPTEERQHLIAGAKKSLRSRQVHRYVEAYFCYGQRQPSMQSDAESSFTHLSQDDVG